MFKLVLEKAEEPEIKLPTSIGSLKKQESSRKTSAAAAKSLQSCPTLCNPTDGSPPGSAVPGIPQARTLEWVAISFSNAWKWNRSVVSDSLRPLGLQPTRLLRPWDFPGKSTGVGCHCLLRFSTLMAPKPVISPTIPSGHSGAKQACCHCWFLFLFITPKSITKSYWFYFLDVSHCCEFLSISRH